MPDTDQLLRFLSFLRIVSSFLISGYGFLFSCKTPITNFFFFFKLQQTSRNNLFSFEISILTWKPHCLSAIVLAYESLSQNLRLHEQIMPVLCRLERINCSNSCHIFTFCCLYFSNFLLTGSKLEYFKLLLSNFKWDFKAASNLDGVKCHLR